MRVRLQIKYKEEKMEKGNEQTEERKKERRDNPMTIGRGPQRRVESSRKINQSFLYLSSPI